MSGRYEKTDTLRLHSTTSVLTFILLFSDSVHPGGEECFEVDRRSGEVRTTGRPLTPSREYLLRVQATDRHGRKGPLATVAILAGYRPPQFTNSTYILNVQENTPVGQP